MNNVNPNYGFEMVPSMDDNEKKNTEPVDVQFYLRKRYYVAALSFLGNGVMYLLRVNLSICLIEMTSNKTITDGNSTYIQEAEYNWSSAERGIILSSISWGLLMSPFTVVIVNKLGVAKAFGFAIFLTGLLTILSPIFIQFGFHFYVACRFLEGVTESLAVAAVFGVIANWIPSKEISRLTNIIILGSSAGIIVGYPLSGYISEVLNWKNVFHVTGSVAIIWSVLWILTVGNSFSTDIFITQTERLFLKRVLENADQTKKNEFGHWKSVLKSKPVWAYLNEAFVESWSFSFMTYLLPMFIKDVHHATMDKIGIFSSLPHICNIVMRILGSWYQDYLRTKGIMSKTKIHKIYIAFGQISAVLLLIITGLWRNFQACLVILCLFQICFAMADVSYSIIPMDMAPQYTSEIASLKLTSMSIGYFLNPIVGSYMVSNHTYSEWSHYFWFLSIFNLWGLLIFSRYGSSELQPWASSK